MVSVLVQVSEHMPPAQRRPCPHTLPHEPQLLGSVAVLTHPASPHAVCVPVPQDIVPSVVPPPSPGGMTLPSSPPPSSPPEKELLPLAQPAKSPSVATLRPTAKNRPQLPMFHPRDAAAPGAV